MPSTFKMATGEIQISWKENEKTPQLPATKMLWYRKIYLPEGGESLKNPEASPLFYPEASPLFYPDASCCDIPPSFTAAAECDVLRSDAEAYHAKLQKNGVDSKIVIYKGMPHTTMVMNDKLTQGANLVRNTIGSIKNAFYS